MSSRLCHPALVTASNPVGHAVPPAIDGSALLATQIVMSAHTSGWHDLEDAIKVYEWMRRDARKANGLVIYESPRQAAIYLHGLRLLGDRDNICQDPYCPGGDAGPAEVTRAARPGAETALSSLAVSTTRFVTAYHPATTLAQKLSIYQWVVETQALEDFAAPTEMTGAERNENRIDYAAHAVDLLHGLQGVHGACRDCARQAGEVKALLGGTAGSTVEGSMDGVIDLGDLGEFF